MSRCGAALAAAAVVTAGLLHGVPADAAQAVLWACHGPAGEPLGAATLRSFQTVDGAATIYGAGCDGRAESLEDGGLRATFARADPEGGSAASWSLDVPDGVALRSLRIMRRTVGFGGGPVPGDRLRYVSATTTAELESARLDDASNVALTGTLSADPASGVGVRLGVDCGLAAGARCASPAGTTVAVEAGAIALGVVDDGPPHVAVGGVSDPVTGPLALTIGASDAGLGLASAVARLDGADVATAPLGGPGCVDLSPRDPPIDLALGADCPTSVANVALTVDTSVVPDGPHRLQVLVADAAGNTVSAVDRTIAIRNAAPLQSPTAQLQFGGAGATGLGSRPAGQVPEPGAHRVAADRCPRPKLSMVLAQAPLRTRRGVAVLRANRPYRFTGSLTCQAGNRRVGAPRDTPIELRHVVGGRSRSKSGATTRVHGAITLIATFPSSRSVEFRYRSADGRLTRVRIRLTVVPAPKHRRGGLS